MSDTPDTPMEHADEDAGPTAVPLPAPFVAPDVFFTEADARRIAETTVEYGWYSPTDRVMVAIDGHGPWSDTSLGFAALAALHAWEPIDPILAAHSSAPDDVSLSPALDFAHGWLALGLSADQPDAGTAGRRAMRLAYLADVADDEGLRAAALTHVEALAGIDPSEPTVAAMDAITGLVALAHRTGAGPARDELDATLTSHLDAAFTPDGIHRSQSPGVQHYVLECLQTLLDAGFVDDDHVNEVRTRGEHALAWFVAPDGILANFGETRHAPISPAYDLNPSGVRALPDRIDDAALLHAASRGRFGAPPELNRAIFHEGGFAVIKEPWPTFGDDPPPSSLLVVRTGPPTGGTDTDAGLAFTWFDSGRHLLVEPGPPIRRDHPAARYAETPGAHNRIVIGPPLEPDDTTTDRPDATALLNGGLQRWGVMEGHYFIDAFEATDTLRHRRSILFEPGAWLVVADIVETASGRLVGPRFHLHEALDIVGSGSGFAIVDGTDPVAWATALDGSAIPRATRGEVAPAAAGWWSPDGERMVPNWAFGWESEGPGIFVTLFTLDERPEVDRPIGSWFGWHSDRRRARVAVTEWGIVDVDIELVVEEER